MTVMNNLLYILAFFLTVVWAVGYMVLDCGSTIHGLLLLAVMVIMIKIINGKKL